MYRLIQVISTRRRQCRVRLIFSYVVAILLTVAPLLLVVPSRAATPTGTETDFDDTSDMTLVFADDFSTDPNTNGLWTIHRYADDPSTEAAWDAGSRLWHLTLPRKTYRAVAVFANYELTATEWKAAFRYRAGKIGGVNGGGDGFVFMFYKDSAAYGVPAFGTQMGFSLVNDPTVSGYGLQFDHYDSGACDPTRNDYVAIIKDTVCHSAEIFREDDRVADGLWHTVECIFVDGKIKVSIDEGVLFTLALPDPDYTFSGVGFGAGTGAAVGDHQIDKFQLWVRDGAR